MNLRKSLITLLITAILMNLLPASFVQAADGTTTGWYAQYSNCSANDFPVALDNSTANSGQWSVKVQYKGIAGANKYGQWVTNVNGLEKGKTYKIGLAMKSQNTSGKTMYFGWGTLFRMNLASTHDWTDMNWVYTHNSDETSRQMMLTFDSYGDGVWIDDVYVCEVTDGGQLGENLVTNSSFEVGDESGSDMENVASELYSLYNEIMQSDTFKLEDMKKVLGAFKYAPVYTANGIDIDGDLADWEGYPQFGLPTKPDQYHIYQQGCNRDASGYCQYAYDEDYLYLGISVDDDVFEGNNTKEFYWNADSIQIAFCDVDEGYDAEIGFSHDPETDKGLVFSSNYGDEDLAKVKLQTSLTETSNGVNIVYEAAIPWGIKYGDEPLPDGILFDVIINDGDGNKRAYCIELAPGIAEGKSSAEFPYLEFMTDKKDFYGWADAESRTKIGDKLPFSYFFVNEGELKTVTLEVPETGYNETFQVPAYTCVRKQIDVVFEERGNQTVNIIAKANGQENVTTKTVYVEPIASSFEDMLKDVSTKTAELKELIDKCEAQGIAVDYPKVSYTTIQTFSDEGNGYLRQDVNWQNYERTYAEYDHICDLYEKAKAELESYLDGSAEPYSGITHFKTGNVRTDGLVIYANTEKDGVIEERPFWFTGYGHFEGVAKETARMKDLGHSMIQIGMEPIYTIGKGAGAYSSLFYYSESSIVQRWKQYFKEAEDNDVQICLLLGVHTVPDWVYTTYSELSGKKLEDVIITHGIVYSNPIFRELCKVHIRGIMDSFGDYKSLHSICLTNEPGNNADSSFYQGYWAQYLTELYHSDINELNEKYGSEYASFLEVPMTTSPTETIQFYDYMQFNDSIMVDFHQMLADEVKACDPDMPTHSKVMGMGTWRDDPGRRNFLTLGTDYEKYIPFSDYGGNDACGYIDDGHWRLMDKLLNYDMLSGIVEKPSFNSEDHVIMDNDSVFDNPKYSKYVDTDQWQGALHGRGASTLWSWGRQAQAGGTAFYGLFLDRPDCIDAAGRAALDVNRLNYEMEALLTEEPEVAIIYSQSARVWNQAMMNIMNNAYVNCLYNGQKVEFVPESKIEKIHDYKVLIIPNITHISDGTFEEIEKYNGDLVVIGEDSLRADERDNARDEKAVANVLAKAEVIPVEDGGIMQTTPTTEEELDIMHEIFVDAGIQDVELVDAATGERVYKCEFTVADYNGSTLVNIVNYNWDDPKDVKILINGKEAEGLKELRKDVDLDTAFTVEPFTPMLIQVGEVSNSEYVAPTGKFSDVKPSHWANEAVEALSEKNVVAGYEDNTFKPNNEITREEFVKLIVSALNIDTTSEDSGFADVDATAWYAPYVNAAYKAGLVSGKSENTFGIGQKITREEMAVIVRRAVSEIAEVREYAEFADEAEIAEYAKDAVKELYTAGLVNGLSETEFSPKTIVTRAQAAKIIYDALVK